MGRRRRLAAIALAVCYAGLEVAVLPSCKTRERIVIDAALQQDGSDALGSVHVDDVADAAAVVDAQGDLERRRAEYRALAATAAPAPAGTGRLLKNCPEHYGFVTDGGYCGKICSFYAGGLCTLIDGGDDPACCEEHRCNARMANQVPWGRPDGPMPLVCSKDATKR